jgi:RNA polymerase sigma-70 factor (ECF subfamily)
MEAAMPAENDIFVDLLQRLRSGDGRAAAELVERYEPEIRLEIRAWLRLRDPRLRRVFDSMDICQSVMASFFVRVAAGRFDLERPEQLLALLVGMARHKLAEKVRHQQRQRRDIRRARSVGPEEMEVAGLVPPPDRLVADQELLEEFRRRLSPEEQQLADLRAQGQDWAAIAALMGGTPEGRRKQLARTMQRISQELGLEEVSRT